MRALSLLLCLLLPASGFAANAARPGPVLPPHVRPVAAVIPRLAPPVVPAAAAASGTTPTLPERVAAVAERVEADAAGLASASTEGSAAAPEAHLRLLQGGEVDRGAAYVPAPQPTARQPLPAPSPERDAAIRRMKAGSMGFKFGMEAMTTSIPFVALASLGGATAVALLVVAVYGVAQALAGSWAGTLADRLPARAILAGAVLGQAALIAVTVGLGFAGMLTPWVLFPLYAAVGVAVGAAETSRRIVPVLVLGQDEDALRRYNSSLHLWYEVAGVAGAGAAGLVIWSVKLLAAKGLLGALGALPAVAPLAAMAFTPLAALAGAAFFWRVKHGRPQASPESEPQRGSIGVLEAIKLILKDPRLLAVSVAMLLPWIIHRVFEGLVAPMYAKSVLGHEALSGALVSASNLGELIGAFVLGRLTAAIPGPYRWVRWGAYGVAGAWALSLVLAWGLTGWAAVALLVPMVLVFSMTWAGSHLSLETEVQKRVDPRHQPRVFGLLFGAYVVGAALVSLAVGRLLDLLGMTGGMLAVTTLFTLVGAAAWWASRKLK